MLRKSISYIHDLWTMLKRDMTRRWCWIFHRHMHKVWEVTTQYRTLYCRICGEEHARRVSTIEAEDEESLIAWPVPIAVRTMAARWYRHHTKRHDTTC